ncbi:MAG: type IVB secretion system protein IcmJDotN [Legionellaceae bacterium]|nr:type IVB secretion system protein IcmJDotN [Legionellaceae bacterium]
MTQYAEQLGLSATSGAWRLYSARKIDVRFESYAQKVLHRDRYKCQFCGFQARILQEVVNLDGDFANNKLTNLVTSCAFCAQCFFIESVGVGGFGGGTLVYFPEFTQPHLNALCHVLFCAIANDTGYKTTAQMIYRALKTRAQLVEDKYGEGTSDPALLGQLIIESGSVDKEAQKRLFEGVRLLPSRGKFRRHIERWAANALEEK